MSNAVIILLGVQGVTFLAWAFLMFRTLFRLLRDVKTRAGKDGFYNPSVTETLTSFGWFLKEPQYRRDRNILFALTAAVFAVNVLNILLLGPTA